MNKQKRVFVKKVVAFITSFGFVTGALGVSVAVAAITFSGASITGDSSFNSIVGAASTTWDLAGNTLSIQTASSGPITTGSGLFTVGGILSAVNIDRAGTIAIGTSSATGITVGRSGQVVTFPGTALFTGVFTATSVIPVAGLATTTAANIIVANSSGVPAYAALSGDATISSAGVITLATSGVTSSTYGSATVVPVITVDAKGRITTVTTSSVSATPGGSNTQLQYNNGGIFAGDANLTWSTSTQLLTVTGSSTFSGILSAVNIDRAGTIAIGTSSATGITIGRSGQTVTMGGNLTVNGTFTPATSSIALSALATSTAANVIVVNSSNVPTYVTMSGDATISNAGVLSLAATNNNLTTLGNISSIDRLAAGTLTIGNTTTTGITIGRSGQTVVFPGNASTTGTFTVGSAGTPILKHLSATSSVTFGVIASTTCAVQTMTVTGANAGDNVYAAPTPVASGIDTVSSTWSVWTTANTVNIRACNPTAANTASVAAQTWRADVWQH